MDRRTDGPTDGLTDAPTKQGVESIEIDEYLPMGFMQLDASTTN